MSSHIYADSLLSISSLSSRRLLSLSTSALCILITCSGVDLPKDEATKTVLTGIEESIFCRIVKRLVGEKLATEAGYKELVDKKTCFDVIRRRRQAACSGK